jgi:hypothetical protein
VAFDASTRVPASEVATLDFCSEEGVDEEANRRDWRGIEASILEPEAEATADRLGDRLNADAYCTALACRAERCREPAGSGRLDATFLEVSMSVAVEVEAKRTMTMKQK